MVSCPGRVLQLSSIWYHCPECSAYVQAPARLARRLALCSSCGRSVRVPGESGPPPEPTKDGDGGAGAETRKKELTFRDFDRLPVLALGLGAAAGAAAALAWTFLSSMAGSPLGVLAWGVGVGVGAACAALAARGPVVGVWCAGMALVAILAAKAMIAGLGGAVPMDHAMRAFDRDRYQDHLALALEFNKLPWPPSDDDLRHFLIDVGKTDQGSAQEVPTHEVVRFRRVESQMLHRLATERPDYEVWRADAVRDFAGAKSWGERFLASLAPLDLVFMLLGVCTAFGLVAWRQ